MQDTHELIKIAATFIGIIVTILLWWVSRLLSDKKDIITNMVEISNLKERMKQVEQDLKENKKDFDHYKDDQR